jgi:integrase
MASGSVATQGETTLAKTAYTIDSACPVFTDELGRRLSPKAATNAFARIAKKAGVRTTSLHSTRHTAATTAIRSGADIVTVSRMLNHSNPSVTLNIYGHLVPGAEDSTNDMLSDWLDGALSATKTTPGG